MHNILIGKNVAYGLSTETGTVNMAKLPTLTHGAFVAVGDGKTILAADGSNADGIQNIQFLVGLAKVAGNGNSTQASVMIPVGQIEYINFEAYNAPVTQIVEIGPFPSAVGTAEGEISFSFNNNSYLRTIQTDQVRISEWKKAGQTLQSVLNKIVSRINSGTGLPQPGQYKPFMTAAVTGSADANYKLQLTMLSEHVDFSVSSSSLAEDAIVVTTRKAVLSKGKGSDVRRSEDEHSGNLGNAGYGWRNELYFSKPLEADAGTNYDIITMSFAGMHDTPQNKVRAATNWLALAVPTGSAAGAALVAILAKAAPRKYKPSKDQNNETDGNPAGAVGTDPA